MENQKRLSLDGFNYNWDLENGSFSFEDEDAVVFWITKDLSVLLDTIEEISGEGVSELVLQFTGFKQGLQVGDFFKKLNHVSVSEATTYVTKTYASGGWGHVVIEEICKEQKTAVFCIKDSWDYKINKTKGKNESFIPAHFAGVLTGVFGTNIWYEIVHSQSERNSYTKVKYYPSEIPIVEDMYKLTRKNELNRITELEEQMELKSKQLNDIISRISPPIIPVLEGIVVVPLLGKYGEDRSQELFHKMIDQLPDYKADYLILDLTGMKDNLTDSAATLIEKIVSSATLIGVKTILTGISPELSKLIAKLHINLSEFDCYHSLKHGVHYALSQMGRRVLN
ncbi:STAS domain-containing protein [Ornithinibacillus halophilus]|uniref:Anti-anti-sigma regulatory factor (Antagonist of anti-sigma factor) n=1 Tax=Ornithinibacillus halophilus TaxID=930117 RepID=A0A1M5KCV9_9BACI|nr:STAS domain-containing protein [Ornithinibacillus halophilus]SHG50575.1 Anti-anti-sigma regulatory factor (antagonist of anti-sigma factor) [Ornithinibacillus halophilus]